MTTSQSSQIKDQMYDIYDQTLVLMGLSCSYGLVGLCAQEVFSLERYHESEWSLFSPAPLPTLLIAVPSTVIATIATVLLFKTATPYSKAGIRILVKMFQITAILALLPPALSLMVIIIFGGPLYSLFLGPICFCPLFAMVGGCFVMGPIVVMFLIQGLVLLVSDFDPKYQMLTMEALLFWIMAQRLTLLSMTKKNCAEFSI